MEPDTRDWVPTKLALEAITATEGDVTYASEAQRMTYEHRSNIPGYRAEVQMRTVRLWLANGYGVELTHIGSINDDDDTGVSVIAKDVHHTGLPSAVTSEPAAGLFEPSAKVNHIIRTVRIINGFPRVGTGPARRMDHDHRLNTIADIKAEAKRHESHFFDRSTMRFFNSLVSGLAYPTYGPDGSFFVTSERQDDDDPRRYTVRQARFRDAGDGSQRLTIDRVGEFQQYASGSGAHARARQLAGISRAKHGFID